MTDLTLGEILVCEFYLSASDSMSPMSSRGLKPVLPPGPCVPAALQLLASWKRPAGRMQRLRRRYGKRYTVQLPFHRRS